MAVRASVMALVLGLGLGLVCGDASAGAADDAPPDPALLEFLGEWDDGTRRVLDWEMLDATQDAPPADDPDAER